MGSGLIQITVDTATTLLGGLGGGITGFFYDVMYHNHDIATDPTGTLTADVLTEFAQFAFVILGVSVAIGFIWVMFGIFKR